MITTQNTCPDCEFTFAPAESSCPLCGRPLTKPNLKEQVEESRKRAKAELHFLMKITGKSKSEIIKSLTQPD